MQQTKTLLPGMSDSLQLEETKGQTKTEQSRKQKEKKKKQTSTLADQNKKARVCGLSYGKYVAQKYAPVVRKHGVADESIQEGENNQQRTN